MAETIAQAVEQIRSTVFGTNPDESATKQFIILRLLKSCGWDQFDLSEVVPEYTVGQRRVDYALVPGSANAMFIEVKRLGENLANHQEQLLEYCFHQGVKLAALTNGRIWHLYLPLQGGNWEKRRFLTIDLASQEPAEVQQQFREYLSRDNVVAGRAVNHAEDLVQSQQRAETIAIAIVDAWNEIIESPDELLVELIRDATERHCGFAPEPTLIQQFLSQRVQSITHVSKEIPVPISPPESRVPPARGEPVAPEGTTLPITFDPPNIPDFKQALLQTREAWIEEVYKDGQTEVRPWHASRMTWSSDVISNVRSKARYRNGTWQKLEIVSLRVSVTYPGS